jgi:hypothetical protein
MARTEVDRLYGQGVQKAATELQLALLETAKAESRYMGITLNVSHSSVSNLNLGTQVGQIQTIVSGLEGKGLPELAAAVKTLTESILDAPPQILKDSSRRDAVEVMATIGEEIAKPVESRSPGVLRALGTNLLGLVGHVDKVAAAYELLKAGAKTQGIELP